MSYYVIQLVALLTYAILMALVLRYAQTRLKRLFLIYLVASATWSLTSLLASLPLPREQGWLWGRLVPFTAFWTIVSYACFIASSVRKWARGVARLGYLSLTLVSLLIILGFVPQRLSLLENGLLRPDYGYWLPLLTFWGAAFVVTSVVLMLKSYFSSTDADHRNRIAYLLLGTVLLVFFGLLWEALPVQSYAVDHLGHLGNALVLSYALLRYRLPDVKLVMRKGLVYTGVTVFIAGLYLGMLNVLNRLVAAWSPSVGLAATLVLILVIACVFDALRTALQKGADRLLYGERYDYRQMLLGFADRMRNVLDLEELSEAMLSPLTNAVRASQASLLFASNGHFSTQFAQRLAKDESVIPVSLSRDSPIVSWLVREDKPLSRETINITPEFKGLSPEDRNTLNAAEVDLLCPIKSKNKLVAILALSRKHPRGFYSRDDTDLLTTLTREAAVAIENAQLYARAKQRANTDELTGLFNHRYFHERLDEEIARCSRFGDIYSLLFLDLDLFRTYNDVHGHLAGDEVLEQVARSITESVRNTDICFRYGGDEFAVILPRTSIDDAYKVAERIRRVIESRTDWQGSPLTCSIGVASWPTDAVMREEIIQAADTALYYAKQTGRNRISLACEVALSEVLRMQSGMNSHSREAILSTIYALAATVDAKDHYTYGHSKKVGKYAVMIARGLGYSREQIETIRAAALLHDIGKIGISDQLLKKGEPLSSEEWEQISAHSNLGVAILKHVDSLKGCLAAVQYHHEHYDGKGYPTGLKGDNIPLDARILAVADAYDAMTSQRPYRNIRLTHRQAMTEVQCNAGTQFDPRVVEAFVRGMEKSGQAEVKTAVVGGGKASPD
ncbi:MAG: diguanylate cyclase [Chloroflexota bacterium]